MGINPTVYTKRTFSPLPKSMAGIDLENKIEDFIRILNHGDEELRLKRKEDIKTQEKDIITINENGNIRTPENGNVRTQENEMDIQMLSAEQPHRCRCEEALRKSNRLKKKTYIVKNKRKSNRVKKKTYRVKNKSVDNKFSCPKCVYSYPIFLQRHLWKSHQFTQGDASEFVNKLCKDLVNTTLDESVKSQRIRKTDEEENLSVDDRLRCQICGKVFTHKGHFKQHVF